MRTSAVSFSCAVGGQGNGGRRVLLDNHCRFGAGKGKEHQFAGIIVAGILIDEAADLDNMGSSASRASPEFRGSKADLKRNKPA